MFCYNTPISTPDIYQTSLTDEQDAGISRREQKMRNMRDMRDGCDMYERCDVCDRHSQHDIIGKELSAVEAEERAWLPTDDIHPYKSRVPYSKGNTVAFPKITRFNTYLLHHYGAEIVEEINKMLYDGELAAICGVDGFHSQKLNHDQCRIDPRMSFWRVNQCEFTAESLFNFFCKNARDCDRIKESRR